MQNLLDFLDKYGQEYNTKDSSLFFYSLTKLKKFNYFLELGTGLGCTSFAVATAMKENKKGLCISFDNGIHQFSEYESFIENQSKNLNIQKHFKFNLEDINFNNFNFNFKLDCIFSDFDRRETSIDNLINWSLSNVMCFSSIFIDGVAEHNSSYFYLKLLIDSFNNQKIPNNYLNHKNFIETHTFNLITIRKDDSLNVGQSNMCWIKIEPNNVYFKKIKQWKC